MDKILSILILFVGILEFSVLDATFKAIQTLQRSTWTNTVQGVITINMFAVAIATFYGVYYFWTLKESKSDINITPQ